MTNPSNGWPPAYTLKRHAKARHVSFRASQLRGIEVTVPKRFNLKYLPEIFEQNKAWLLKQLEKIEQSIDHSLPQELSILGQKWQIEYVVGTKVIVKGDAVNHKMIVATNFIDDEASKHAIMRWVKSTAKIMLLEYLQQISSEINIPYTSARVRSQKSLWGSCTSKRNISLNYRLLLLPLNIIRYVIIHELCHIKHMNHSQRFWDLVARFDPDWKIHRKQLKNTSEYIPSWMCIN